MNDVVNIQHHELPSSVGEVILGHIVLMEKDSYATGVLMGKNLQ